MKHVRRLVVILLAAVLGVTAMAPQAVAARGIFLYYEPDGGLGIVDPDDDWCYQLGYTVRELNNDTNRTAFLFADDSCLGGPFTSIPPHSTFPAPDSTLSVVFHRGSNSCCMTIRNLPDSARKAKTTRHCTH
ncbi:hypothetical protein [Actinokineospora inagensis]|uniref:hypothetical protein n=1 Tax=Actinokineospora inagensis TaxID=103730 RepID=UPI000411CB1C|nr:hypothetical protein [Actinokineospora inagensis]